MSSGIRCFGRRWSRRECLKAIGGLAVGTVALASGVVWLRGKKSAYELGHEKVVEYQRLSCLKIEELLGPENYDRCCAAMLAAYDEFAPSLPAITGQKNRDTFVLRTELLALYRVGPETADSILLYALDKPVFVIDAYTKRIFSRHGCLNETASYEAFQNFFTDNLPCDRDLFNDFHAQIVHLGHRFCRPVPDCDACPLSEGSG